MRKRKRKKEEEGKREWEWIWKPQEVSTYSKEVLDISNQRISSTPTNHKEDFSPWEEEAIISLGDWLHSHRPY